MEKNVQKCVRVCLALGDDNWRNFPRAFGYLVSNNILFTKRGMTTVNQCGCPRSIVVVVVVVALLLLVHVIVLLLLLLWLCTRRMQRPIAETMLLKT